ncbi:choice-of-anchor A domain-containing protein [Kineothrix alysoides]|uniref:Choice-of-anchor A domain-containing protein n=1 Tax=Kineothrix alysoides TaxID=1469948 RepID=A0A4R1QW31_9FIRM|nr:collagen-binding domain-containing protein [Kineothrix alysoides]TCL57543.1 choice-of-anchor A domain-containing protein [Kineothrix alysoides]
MDYNITSNKITSKVGIPYDDIRWQDVTGQPFGTASQFNAIVFGNANNIVDANGAMAVGGNFVSPRGLSLAFGGGSQPVEIGYSPDMVRFLVGNNVSMNGPLGVVGHVVAGGNFRTDKGSTYFIGKSGEPGQVQKLESLYHSDSGSPYWKPSDKGDHYIIPSYDVPRFIPASRIGADTAGFFQDARNSIENYKNCIENLPANGEVIDNFHEWILRGNNPQQNVFTLDVPNGILKKGIRAEVPEGSLVIVKLRTGDNAHLQYGLIGERSKADHTLYVFEDAKNIFMEVPAAIWGSILAPQAMFHAHSTGGNVTGNVALNSFAVNPTSGFEFHLPPFTGGVMCETGGAVLPATPVTPAVPVTPTVPVTPVAPVTPTTPPTMVSPETVVCPVCPEPAPCPIYPTCPEPLPCPICPEQMPCPVCPSCPEQMPCPVCPSCPEQMPCPICPEPVTCPVCPTCPEPVTCPVCPTCPQPMPCPVCPTCPEPMPCPVCPVCPVCPEPVICPECPPCPACPVCPEQMSCPECPPCPECMITPGLIAGYIKGCSCCSEHEWELRLYQIFCNTQVLLSCKCVSCFGYFEFEVPYSGSYLLQVCPSKSFRKSFRCKPNISLNNIGVSNFMME